MKGIQSALGYEEKIIGRYTYKTWHGIGICGAVTFWTMHKWLRSNEVSFPKFAKELSHKIESHTEEYRTDILNFMKNTTTELLKLEDHNNTHLSKYPNRFSEKTFRALKKDIRSRKNACNCKEVKVDIVYNVSLGSIEGGGTLEFLHC